MRRVIPALSGLCLLLGGAFLAYSIPASAQTDATPTPDPMPTQSFQLDEPLFAEFDENALHIPPDFMGNLELISRDGPLSHSCERGLFPGR